METIFDKIIAGSIPCHKIYEDDLVLAILDIHPINEGHALVIPKTNSSNFTDLNNEYYQHLMKTVKIIADRLQEIYQPPKIGVIIEGFEVPKTHVHVFPAYSAEDFHKSRSKLLPATQDELLSALSKITLNKITLS